MGVEPRLHVIANSTKAIRQIVGKYFLVKFLDILDL